MPVAVSFTATAASSGAAPSCCRRSAISRGLAALRTFRTFRRLWWSENRTSTRQSARRLSQSWMCWSSVRSLRRNLRRAGVLKKRSRTSTEVPGGWGVGSGPTVPMPPVVRMVHPASLARTREDRIKVEIDPMLGSASPRKPRLASDTRSSKPPILLVA